MITPYVERRAYPGRHMVPLDEVIPKHVFSWPRSAGDIFKDVRNDYGEVTDRTLWRALKRLCHRGVIEHIGPDHGGQYQTGPAQGE